MVELLDPLPRWLVLETPALITGEVVQAFKDAFPYTTVGSWKYVNGTYTIEEPSNYAKLGDLSPGKFNWNKSIGVPALQKEIKGAHWVPDRTWIPGCGEWLNMGKWYVPPPTPAPTFAPTIAPTPAPTPPKMPWELPLQFPDSFDATDSS